MIEHLLTNTMTFDAKYNINKEMDDYLEVIYEILIDLDDIKDTLERGISITNILSPPFDPFKTIGKY